MGFDNECILNIQSLAGEYFCPVCRLLVYPNEALQSQCTHLYCKPCLTYVVSTTRACPYDGYLVTEADSKPLVESNKALADTIGKITVHCLYHRSGCTWQGPLSECTAHCSGCAFGNSPVVCNRCGVQIVHRQVQEHAQNCPRVQPQAQQVVSGQEISASGTTSDQTQVASQAGTAASQSQASQTTTSSTSVQDFGQQANPNPQSQAVSQFAAVTSEQWSQQQQQQQQSQQYYQQYTGYDSYYQQYYPYQQQAFPQYQQQSLQVNATHMAGQNPLYLQTQSQPQSHLPVQVAVASQPQSQAQANQQQQTHLTIPLHYQIPAQTYPTSLGHSQPLVQPLPQAQPHPQVQTIQPHLQHGHMPQYQQQHSQMQLPQPQPPPAPQVQPHSQAQPQAHQLQPLPQPQLQPHPQPSQPLNPNLLPQTQPTATQAVTGHQSYLQSQPHQLVTLQNPLHMHAQGGLHPQQHPVEMQNSYPQQPSQMRPPQSHAAIPNQQQPGSLPLPNPMLHQAHHHSVQHPLSAQPQRVIQPPTSLISHQYMQQQPLSTQPLGLVQPQMHQQGPFVQQQQPMQSQFRPPGPPQSFQQPPHAYQQPQQNVAEPNVVHPYPMPNPAGRPLTPNHGLQSQPYPQSAPAMLVKPMQLGVNQPSYQ
ncbi:putative mediator of RNA polymerase II transcription subunit 12 [Hibiscus syriacus]|uniref:putative mediator of RNA polymerase II transcription subunit 12 n=1 Tax=Hibiscus syriacus TaxID=106335 RepID=UPI001922998D|nr:putative mediator of RNA polymerase II transcription subunit 12 [Hibiscus syriacus]